jgi:Plavaka transposase
MAYILLALLPVPTKLRNISTGSDENQRRNNREALHSVIQEILRPLNYEGPISMDCADGMRRDCFPILAAWIADHEEHMNLHNINRNLCPKCEIPLEHLGSTPSKNTFRVRNHDFYQAEFQRYLTTDDEKHLRSLTSAGLKGVKNVFWTLSRVEIGDLHKPDLLHNIYLGIFKHLMEWLEEFLEENGRLKAFDDAWIKLSPYPGFTAPKKTYREVSQWQGKEMRNLGRILLGVVAVALKNPTSSQKDTFRRTTLCVRAIVDFHLMAQYRSHTSETLSFMEQYLMDFHKYKDVFLQYRSSKKSKEIAKQMDKELQDTQKTLIDSVALPATKRRRIETKNMKERRNQTISIYTAGAHFNFIKMHLLTHFRTHVERFGSIPMYSTEFGESAHRDQIKDGYRRSNKNNATKQILDRYDQQHAILMRERTLQVLCDQPGYEELVEDVRKLGLRKD